MLFYYVWVGALGSTFNFESVTSAQVRASHTWLCFYKLSIFILKERAHFACAHDEAVKRLFLILLVGSDRVALPL